MKKSDKFNEVYIKIITEENNEELVGSSKKHKYVFSFRPSGFDDIPGKFIKEIKASTKEEAWELFKAWAKSYPKEEIQNYSFAMIEREY